MEKTGYFETTTSVNNNSNLENDFFNKVYEITLLIPFGRVSTYGAIARFTGATRSARMVGWALNKSAFCKTFIPAHRVVNRNGLLTGKHFFRGQNVMKQMLESEGIEVNNDQIVNFSKYFWDPNKELI